MYILCTEIWCVACNLSFAIRWLKEQGYTVLQMNSPIVVVFHRFNSCYSIFSIYLCHRYISNIIAGASGEQQTSFSFDSRLYALLYLSYTSNRELLLPLPKTSHTICTKMSYTLLYSSKLLLFCPLPQHIGLYWLRHLLFCSFFVHICISHTISQEHALTTSILCL